MSIEFSADAEDLSPVNIVVVDPRRLSREALRRLISSQALAVVAEGATLGEALQNVPAGTSIQLLIQTLDSDGGIEAALPEIQKARLRFGGLKAVVLTDCSKPASLLHAVRSGVEAFLSRDISAEVLRRALELVLNGQHLLPGNLAQLVFNPAWLQPDGAIASDLTPSRPAAEAMPRFAERSRTISLSKRECQILQCLVDGLSNKMIARDLDITEATVKVHVKALLRKTQTANRTQAAIWAVNHWFGGEAESGEAASLLQGKMADAANSEEHQGRPV
ncbi:response regulator transcription factor [Roseomonas sp. M0104]|uniref:Response regulator transcription factor n=1 Tax=Teichococcus coralli TaxID=2545983 RepID=A0A845BD22_9PROT|nr:response regulator transcription factor [Pseudoroseomonas coralli]MXP63247.1 response regulator transcription factor [Pseudoroseomonas coralli]